MHLFLQSISQRPCILTASEIQVMSRMMPYMWDILALICKVTREREWCSDLTCFRFKPQRIGWHLLFRYWCQLLPSGCVYKAYLCARRSASLHSISSALSQHCPPQNQMRIAPQSFGYPHLYSRYHSRLATSRSDIVPSESGPREARIADFWRQGTCNVAQADMPFERLPVLIYDAGNAAVIKLSDLGSWRVKVNVGIVSEIIQHLQVIRFSAPKQICQKARPSSCEHCQQDSS